MISLRRVFTLAVSRPVSFSFVNDKFLKERDDAAEKVYISRQESNSSFIQRNKWRSCSRSSARKSLKTSAMMASLSEDWTKSWEDIKSRTTHLWLKSSTCTSNIDTLHHQWILILYYHRLKSVKSALLKQWESWNLECLES